MLSDDDLDTQGEDEQALFNLIKNRTFIHTKAYNADLLIKTGMHIDFENVENVDEATLLLYLMKVYAFLLFSSYVLCGDSNATCNRTQ